MSDWVLEIVVQPSDAATDVVEEKKAEEEQLAVSRPAIPAASPETAVFLEQYHHPYDSSMRLQNHCLPPLISLFRNNYPDLRNIPDSHALAPGANSPLGPSSGVIDPLTEVQTWRDLNRSRDSGGGWS